MKRQDYGQLTFFPEDSPVSHSAQPGSEEARTMTVISGRKCLELYVKSGPLGLLARMLLESSAWRSTRCFLTWRLKDTPCRRLLYQLAPSMPRTGETESRLLPTPIASDCQRASSGNHSSLLTVAKMIPTPTARDYKGSNSMKHLTETGGGRKHVDQLANWVKLFPTPRAQNANGKSNPPGRQGSPDLQTVVGGQLNPEWVEWLMGFPIGWTALDA